ncbi:unnamed protein product [Closterium sp. Naga37s-1]|nr:unnamed protein product [Closterium sp. Naga37s-1]
MLCPDTAHLLLGNFCIYHIDAPGHEAGAEEISPLEAQLTASDLAEQVAEVMAWFRLPPAVCIGVGAGAYVLTLLALERPQAVQSLVLVSPVCRAASWAEWARSKVLLGVLCVAGMSKYVKDALVHRYFCHQQTGFHGPASDSILMFRQELDNREPENVMRYLDIIHSRIDLTPFLLHLKCPVLLVAGEMSEASMQEAAHMMCHLDPMTTSWVQVEASGALVTEERPHMLRKPLESFFARQGMHCVSPFAASLDYCEAVAAAAAAAPRLIPSPQIPPTPQGSPHSPIPPTFVGNPSSPPLGYPSLSPPRFSAVTRYLPHITSKNQDNCLTPTANPLLSTQTSLHPD